MSPDRRKFIGKSLNILKLAVPGLLLGGPAVLIPRDSKPPDLKSRFETAFEDTFSQLKSKPDGFDLETDDSFAVFTYQASTTQGKILMIKGLLPPPSFEAPDIFDPTSLNLDRSGRTIVIYEQTYAEPEYYRLAVLASSDKQPLTFYGKFRRTNDAVNTSRMLSKLDEAIKNISFSDVAISQPN